MLLYHAISDGAMQAGRTRRPGKRITSPEKWEINQLIKAGVLDVSEYPTFDAEDGQVGTGHCAAGCCWGAVDAFS
jgi:hypothetical protein